MAETSQPRLVVPGLGGIYQSLAPFMEAVLRFAAGAMLVPHGCQKLFGLFGGGGLTGTAKFMESVGYAPGMLWAVVVGCTEIIAGTLLAIGLFTRPAAAAITIQMIFVLNVTLKRGWMHNSNELAVLWFLIVVFFLVRGSTRCSVDRTLGREFQKSSGRREREGQRQ